MSARHSSVNRMDKTIDYSFWLIFDGDGGMRFARGEPTVKRGERSMHCRAKLPLSIFSAPELRATIAIADPNRGVIQVDVEAASAALKSAIGVDIDLRVQHPEA